ncbi:hypothetical protein BDM02DRAFT_2899345 [Thelephora ganbajun]|uniref:Uncharacterized protein n=1 Tax=Thelephora ganbajun TaxID=370292 RepID=A0ACB6ZRZ6_THEGA|nr:hypothetical protein BDM02DRAFT_2899345 [Thelephora ganbajun]
MTSTMSIATPRQHSKPKNSKKPRLTPKQCREVTDHWKTSVGTDQAKILVREYIAPGRLPSAKETAYRVHNDFTYRLQQDYSVSYAHSNTGGRRNPGRGDGQTWNGDSFICAGQVDSDYSNVDPFIESCMMNCGDYCDQESTRPRTIEISLADVPMKVRKPKQRKARGYEALPSAPRAPSILPSELGEPSFHQDFETMSNFSWDAMTSDNLSVFSEEDWEDLESAYTHDTLDYELDRDLRLLRIARNDSDSSTSSPSTTPPQRTYAQALANKT